MKHLKVKAKKSKNFLSPSATPRTGTSPIVSPTPSRPASPLPALGNPVTTVGSPPVPASLPSSSGEVKSKQKIALESASSFRTLLKIVESMLDGVPIWGPKAAFATAGEIVKIAQLKSENDNTIKDVKREAENVLSMTSEEGINAESDPLMAVPRELQERIDKFREEVERHLHDLDPYQAADALSGATKLSDRVKKWLALGEEFLAAEAISNALPEVNKKISGSIQNFILVGQIKNETIARATLTKVVAIEGDVKAIREAQNISILPNDVAGITNSPLTTQERDLLEQLRPIKTALHGAEGAARTCHEGTRVAILQEVQTWFRDPGSASILWLCGIAGTGKTTIAQSICEKLEADLGASFLFSRDFVERRRPSNILPTIAYQLACSRPALRPAIYDMLSKNPDFASKSVRVQAKELLFSVLGSNLTPNFSLTLLVFDGLDECDKENFQEGGDFIPHLLRFLRTYSSRFKVIITSRPETSIRGMLEGGNKDRHLFVLHEVDEDIVQSDIETYLRYELAQIAKRRGLESAWPVSLREKQVKQLSELANRLFIFAATVVKALSKSPFPTRTIRSFLEKADRPARGLHVTLDSMYLQIIGAFVLEEATEEDASDLIEDFQRVVGAIVTLQQPLHFSSLGGLLKIDEVRLHSVIGPLYSVLDVDDSFQRPLQFFHSSFPDFLTDDKRCTDARFHIVPETAHTMLSIRCLHVMNQQLKQNICKIGDPGLLNGEVTDLADRLKRYTSAELRYACFYWWIHLGYVKCESEELLGELESFASERLLEWLELLSLTGQLRSALIGLPKAITWYKGTTLSSEQQGGKHGYKKQKLTATLLYDAKRAVQTFFTPIFESALQVYESALTFMPECSLTSKSHKLSSGQVTMTSKRGGQWSQEVRVIEGHNGSIEQVVVSPNGSLLASFSDDKTIRLWDFVSGTQILQIDYEPYILSFSPDSSQLLCLTNKLDALNAWDVTSGDRLSSFNLRLENSESKLLEDPKCGAISPIGRHVAIGTTSSDLYIFAVAGVPARLQGHTKEIGAVAFSHDGLRIASGSNDRAIRIWDIQSLSCIEVLHSLYDPVIQVYISRDGSTIVAASGTSRSSTEFVVQSPLIDGEHIFASRCLPDYKKITVNDTSIVFFDSEEKTLCTYAIAGGDRSDLFAKFEGHTGQISCINFSPDGSYIVSGSDDSIIHVWNTQVDGEITSSSEGHNARICSLAFSANGGGTLISASIDGTVCFWETRSGKLILRNEKGPHVVGFLLSGAAVGLSWEGSTIEVWNAETAQNITTLRGHSRHVNDAAFSPDFTRLASGSDDRTVRIWNTATWNCTVTLTGHTGGVLCVCFSPDGSRVVSGSWYDIRVWDAGTGDELAVLKGHAWQVTSVRFSSDGLSIVSKDYIEEREWKAGVDFPLPTLPSPLLNFFHLDDFGWLFITVSSFHRRRLCWLPAERRNIIEFSGLTVALGGPSGIITILAVSDTVL